MGVGNSLVTQSVNAISTSFACHIIRSAWEMVDLVPMRGIVRGFHRMASTFVGGHCGSPEKPSNIFLHYCEKTLIYLLFREWFLIFFLRFTVLANSHTVLKPRVSFILVGHAGWIFFI